MLTIGKLYGVMQATTPTGARRASAPMRPAGAIGVAGISWGASGMTFGSSAPRAYRSNRLAATGTCIARPTAVVHPVSAITRGTKSSSFSRTRTAAADSSSARCSGVVCDHDSNASRAARAASRACCTDASGATPTTSSVAGLTIS